MGCPAEVPCTTNPPVTGAIVVVPLMTLGALCGRCCSSRGVDGGATTTGPTVVVESDLLELTYTP